MHIIKDKITLAELKKMSEKMFGELVKGVVNIDQEIMAVDAQMHSDLEELLLENGSQQESLWGINLHPNQFGSEEFIVFDSMINIRPNQGNRTRSVENIAIQKKIRTIVNRLVIP